MFSKIKSVSFISLLAMSFVIMSCNDTTMTDIPAENEIETLGIDAQPNSEHYSAGTVSGRTIGGINVLGTVDEVSKEFTGRITNLRLTEGDEPGQVLASGRLIGTLNGERINRVFDNISLPLIDSGVVPENAVCPILYLEIAPIFLNVLGLIVEIPETVIVEIRAERGPGALLGNLLCGLLGILD